MILKESGNWRNVRGGRYDTVAEQDSVTCHFALFSKDERVLFLGENLSHTPDIWFYH